MISFFDFPSAVRRLASARVSGQRRRRLTAIMCRARLAWRSPPGLRRFWTRLPDGIAAMTILERRRVALIITTAVLAPPVGAALWLGLNTRALTEPTASGAGTGSAGGRSTDPDDDSVAPQVARGLLRVPHGRVAAVALVCLSARDAK